MKRREEMSSLKDLERLKEEGINSLFPSKTKILVGMATCGQAAGAGEVWQALDKEVKKRKIDVLMKKTGCIGLCQHEPLVDILKPGYPRITYDRVTPDGVGELIDGIVKGKFKKGIMARIDQEEFLLEDTSKRYNKGKVPAYLASISTYKRLPFYKKQMRIALRNCGFIDPENIAEYVAKGGYFTLARILNGAEPDKVISLIKRSKLRGRGGAGFLTGLKWEICRSAEGEGKYLICNADEGDPGAYMDRSILEGDPHSIIEGMLIGGFAIGANQGYVYVREEYPLAIERLEIALNKALEEGFLGKNIFGSGFDFEIEISRGAGAFVCGEETALIQSIEGNWGEPKPRPPFPAISGLWGKPTVINNVETLSNVPAIMARGAKWFSGIGTSKSKGTKVFSLVGQVCNIGLVEVPMGITLKDIIYGIGGGVPNGRKFKAVQTGGPSGGCIPKDLIGLPVDFDQLKKAGSIMGSGGMIVMDDRTCMVDVAKYFLSFLEDESCGKCVPCRVGIRRMREILEDITSGRGEEGDIDYLQQMAEAVKDGSLCGLGKTAPNPVLATIRYFRDEYEAHIKEKRCPAGVCKALITYSINAENCTGCGACLRVCPQEAITGKKKKPHQILIDKCIKCGACFEVCKFDAIVT
jgi:NADH:ubiquinone oxidoreductase subunit F (NADH-binding)/(2Fe-2S) ferredoxin